MKLRGLIIATFVLAALVGVLYWSNHHKPSETSEASAETAPKILSLKEDDIAQVDLKKKGAADLVVSRDGAGKWQITAPKPLAAEQASVSGMLANVSSLSAERLVEDKTTNFAQYGLSDPELQAAILEKNKKSYKLLLGDTTPTGSAVYARLDGDPRVFTVASYVKNGIDKSENDLRDKRLLTVDRDKISRIELAARKQEIELGRNKDEWQIVKPKPQRADSSQVDELVRTLADASMDLGPTDDPKADAAAFGSGTPIATAKVTDESGTQELQLRKNKNDYYAKSSAVEGIYKVPSSVGTGLDKNPDDFRNKKLFDFGFNQPDKIELHDGSKAYFLTRGGEDWWNGSGKKMDPDGAQTLIDKLRDLAASKFVDAGFGAVEIDITVVSNDQKNREKVLISKSGDHYVAKRDGEPTLYQLDSKGVAELQKAAADMKLEAAPLAK